MNWRSALNGTLLWQLTDIQPEKDMAGFREVAEAAKGRWASILPSLGVGADFLQDRHGPCPGCGGKDRFRYDDIQGAGNFVCSQGGGDLLTGDGFELLAHVHGWDRGRGLREVAAQVGIEIGAGGSGSYDTSIASAPKAKKVKAASDFDIATLREFVQSCPEKVGKTFLAERSPVPVEWGARKYLALEFLHFLFPPEEKVLIFTKFTSQGDFILWNRKSYRLSQDRGVKATPSDVPFRGADGLWFLSNPVDGQWHSKLLKRGGETQKKWSRRSGESVTHFRYAVLESDEAPVGLWLRALALLQLQIVAIYTSGGKSVHALVRVDATTKADFDRCREWLIKTLSKLGADPAAITAVRLTRLPGCMRGKRTQELLYLNPQATGRAIRELPILRTVNGECDAGRTL